MRTETPPVVRIEDYRPSDFLVDCVELDIRLHPTATRVSARLALRPNPAGDPEAPLVLEGDELTLVAVALDDAPLSHDEVAATPQSLTIADPPRRPFTLAIETEIDPTSNTKLMGLYRSNGVYCTQCEAEGFRRITYFLDRPDVLSIYTTRIEAEREEAPVLLGNGNPTDAGAIDGTTRHYAIWHDPFPKPSYLFAIVGGHLGRVARSFATASGRSVEIAIHVEPGKEDRASYALEALERAMRWDERVFGREYDLDVFNVVAVSDFNMGAMENKGLNIFNDKYVLASPETATDQDYASIEAVIAHEYFHNWTGNRITCRDWFQLCLKEGLTVFRDQEFSSDERSRPVHRIAEVRALRARQFAEDAGPLAHPVRPGRYSEINNFYTATVYEKGAEVVRMLKTLIGADAFRAGMDLYFERCDGTAATVEDFLAAFAEASGRDLIHFARWYEQAGTPRVTVSGAYDEAGRRYRLAFQQTTPPTPEQPTKEPLVIPVALGLIADGGDLFLANDRVKDGIFILDRATDELVIEDVPSRPVPSLFRDFSAPVKPVLDLGDDELLALLRHDSDPFNRWEAGQRVAMRLMLARAGRGPGSAEPAALASALLGFVTRQAAEDPPFAALVLTLPGEADVAQEIGTDVDPDAVHEARRELRTAVGARLMPALLGIRAEFASAGPFSPDATSAGRRALRNTALDLIAAADPAEGERLALEQFREARNMTDRLAALAVLALLPGAAREGAFAAFAEQYAGETLVLDKWLALQAIIPEAGTLDRVTALTASPAYSEANPNRVRALVGSFALNNPTQFHRPDGLGYDFVANTVLALDSTNPQVAARLLTAFGTWHTMETTRRERAERALRRILDQSTLSSDVNDIVRRCLA